MTYKVHLIRIENFGEKIEHKGYQVRTYCGMRGFYHQANECDTADGNRFEICRTIDACTCINCQRYKKIDDASNNFIIRKLAAIKRK